MQFFCSALDMSGLSLPTGYNCWIWLMLIGLDGFCQATRPPSTASGVQHVLQTRLYVIRECNAAPNNGGVAAKESS